MAAKTQTKRKPKSQAGAKTRAKAKVKTKAAAGRVRKKSAAKASAVNKNRSRATKKQAARGTGYSDLSLWESAESEFGPEPPLIKTLLLEHRHMGAVMREFSEQLDAIEREEPIDAHLVYEIMDYMASWPDRFHHPREDLIYARVAELDADGADEVDTLQRDHDHTALLGQRLLDDIDRWRQDELADKKLLNSGRAYISHIYEHMNVEEKLVFPHIRRVLTQQDWRELELEDSLQPVSSTVFGPRVQREYRNVARKVRRRLRRHAERQVVEEWIGIDAVMESAEVVGRAFEASRECASTHVRSGIDDARDILREPSILSPLRMAANNAAVAFELARDVAEISRGAIEDLAQINRERRRQVRSLLAKDLPQ